MGSAFLRNTGGVPFHGKLIGNQSTPTECLIDYTESLKCATLQ